MQRHVAVVLSGCGFREGSEITEAVSTLIALADAGASYQCFAPQSVVAEGAKIARDKILPLHELKESAFDAVIFPGGYGAAKVLCTWASQGARATVDKDVENTVRAFHKAAKPIGAICIAPAMVALVLGHEGVELTIGNDVETAAELEKTGARHTLCRVDDYVSDRDHKVVTTPAYMYDDASPNQVFAGIGKMVRELVEMA